VVTKAAKSRRKINAKTLLTLAFSCSLGLLIVLVFLAFDFYRADARLEVRDVVSTSIHELDKRLGWKLKADSCCRHAKNGNFDVTYTVDAEGFRKTGRALSPTFSITFYGDSYTFGHGVDDAETFASLIANVYLTEDVAVYNAAVNGYGIVQMYQQLLSHLDRIGPGDVVVFTPTSADIERNVKDFVFPYTCAFRRGENQVPIEYYPAYANGRITYTKLERTLWNKLKLLALTAPGARGLWHVIHNRFKPDTTQEALEMVRSARLETERRGGRFVLIFLPRLSECLKRAYQVDVSAFDHHDIMSCFPLEKGELYRLRFKTDSHWNAAAHRVAAKAIVQTLVAEGCIAETYLRPGTSVNRVPEPVAAPHFPGRPHATAICPGSYV